MPQFDITTYGSQIFWLILSFGVLFWALKKIIIPYFKETLLKRQILLDSDKVKIRELYGQQQQQQHQRLHRLELAKTHAQDLVKKTMLQMDEFENKRLKQIQDQTSQHLKDFQTALEKEKESLEKDIDNLVQQSVDHLLPKLLRKE